jgi:hypothetical protein
MAKGKGKKGPPTLWDKVNAVDATFASEVYSMSDEALKEKLVQMASHQADIEAAKEADADLERIKEELKTANQTYSDPLKAIRLKRGLSVQVLKERGKLA